MMQFWEKIANIASTVDLQHAHCHQIPSSEVRKQFSYMYSLSLMIFCDQMLHFLVQQNVEIGARVYFEYIDAGLTNLLWPRFSNYLAFICTDDRVDIAISLTQIFRSVF